MKEESCNQCMEEKIKIIEEKLKLYDISTIKEDVRIMKKTFILGSLSYFIYRLYKDEYYFLAYLLTYDLYKYYKNYNG